MIFIARLNLCLTATLVIAGCDDTRISGLDAAAPGLDADSSDDAGGGADAGPADSGPPMPTSEAVLVIANGVSGTCSSTDLWGTVRPVIDGTPDPFEIGPGMVYLPGSGAHRVQLEYNLFGCDDVFYDGSVPTLPGFRVLLAASGARGSEVVSLVDLMGRWNATANELLLVHLSAVGTLAYRVDGPGGLQQGDFDFGDVEVVPIAAGENAVQVIGTSTLSDTINWPASDLAANMLMCIVRDTPTGEATFECTAAATG